MTDPETPPSTPPPTVPPPEPPTTPPTNPPPGPGAPPEPPPLSDDGSPGAYGATAGAYNAPAAGPSPVSPYASGPYASGVATPPQTLSLTSFIVGLASLVFFWVPVLGFLAAVAAIIIGFIARRREPAAPRWMWLVGIISGFAAALLSLLFLIPFLLFLAFGSVITTNIPIPSA